MYRLYLVDYQQALIEVQLSINGSYTFRGKNNGPLRIVTNFRELNVLLKRKNVPHSPCQRLVIVDLIHSMEGVIFAT
jgi:hypothetical protein